MTNHEEKMKLVRQHMDSPLCTYIEIPPHGNSMVGVDTTLMYSKALTESEQKRHTTMIKAVAKDESARSARKSDVIVHFGLNFCPNLYIGVDTQKNIVRVHVRKMPVKVYERKRDVILQEFSSFMKTVSSIPVILESASSGRR